MGSEVARRAKALGMEVLVHDPYASSAKAAALGVRLSTFDECLQVGALQGESRVPLES